MRRCLAFPRLSDPGLRGMERDSHHVDVIQPLPLLAVRAGLRGIVFSYAARLRPKWQRGIPLNPEALQHPRRGSSHWQVTGLPSPT